MAGSLAHLARAGSAFEARLAPHLYRRSRIVTLSCSSRDEIVLMLRMQAGLAVASRIAGHLDSVEPDVSGILFQTDDELVRVLDEVLSDSALGGRLAKGALARARQFTWDAAAAGTLGALAGEVGRRRQ